MYLTWGIFLWTQSAILICLLVMNPTNMDAMMDAWMRMSVCMDG